MSNNSLFTCVTCYVAFRDAENQRIHFQTEWHTYNLKRKVAQMKPLPFEDFQNKVAAQSTKSKEAEELLNYSANCEICNKQYSSKNAYENHLNSKKHKENELNGVLPVKKRTQKTEAEKTEKVENAMEVESIKSEGEKKEGETEGEVDEELSLIDKKIANARILKEEECLFCLHSSDSFEDNLTHMAKAHSFFIPDVQYLIDCKGLIKYLGQKISVGNVCLYCNEKGKAFHSLYAVQKHMIDKGHCKLWYENDADLEFEEFYDFSSSYPDHQETDADEEPLEPISLSSSNFQMVLPNGSKIGHRAMKGFYKQKFKPEDVRASTTVSKIMSQYRALGWHEQQAEVDARDLKRMNRHKSRMEMELGVKANGLLRHMRKQVMC